MKKCMPIILSLAMVVSMTACDAERPKTAAELVERSMALEDSENFNLSGNMKANISIGASNFSMELPVNIDLNYDFADSDCHAIADCSVDVFGTSIDSKLEMYSTGNTRYVCSGDGKWTKVSAERFNINADRPANLNLTELFQDAQMVYDKAAKTYTVTVKAARLIESDDFQELLSDMLDHDLTDMDNMDLEIEQMVDDILEAFGDGDLTWVYDNTYHLRKLIIQNMNYTGDLPTDEFSSTISASLESDLAYDNWGGVDVDSVKVPASVMESAVDPEDDTQMFEFDYAGENDDGERNVVLTDGIGVTNDVVY